MEGLIFAYGDGEIRDSEPLQFLWSLAVGVASFDGTDAAPAREVSDLETVICHHLLVLSSQRTSSLVLPHLIELLVKLVLRYCLFHVVAFCHSLTLVPWRFLEEPLRRCLRDSVLRASVNRVEHFAGIQRPPVQCDT